MSIYLLQNEQQTGPFTEDQVQHMLQTAAVPGSTLGWKEGMAGWEPVSTFVATATAAGAAHESPPLPPRRNSPLGLISFIVSLVSVPIWLVLLAIAGIAHNAGNISPGFNVIVGLGVIGGCFVNFAALIVGLVAAFKSRPNTLAIIGACLNAFILIGLVGLVCLGLAVRHAG